jgi:hypothetical protein
MDERAGGRIDRKEFLQFPYMCPGNTNPQVEGTLVVAPNHKTLYGLIAQGVNCSGTASIFSLTPPSSPGGAWTLADVHDFSHGDGSLPNQLITDKNGVLYGTTSVGGGTGGTGFGAAFSLTPPATPGGAWTETILHQFTSGADGGRPVGSLLLGSHGELYGDTQHGGTNSTFKGGVAFELIPPPIPGGAWTENVLYNFGSGGNVPTGGLVASDDGTLFGVAGFTVLSLTPPATTGGAWTEQTIFTANLDSSITDLLFANGILYGVYTFNLNNFPNATVITLTPPTSGAGDWSENDLYDFAPGEGFVPLNLILDRTGVLYGVNTGGSANQGEVFALSPPVATGGTWTQNVLHTFDSTINNDGANPSGGLAFCAPGILCGLTQSFGTHRGGTAYTVKP